MKNKILVLLALPLMLIACSDKGLDRGLDGTWMGEVETSDLELLKATHKGSDSNERVLKETFTFKIDGKYMEFYRTKNYQMSNQVEVEKGTYHKSADLLTFDIEKHSCAKEDPTRPLERKIMYKFTEDLDSLVLVFGPNKSVTLKKLEKNVGESLQEVTEAATTGCFANDGSFVEGKIEKPNPPRDEEDNASEDMLNKPQEPSLSADEA